MIPLWLQAISVKIQEKLFGHPNLSICGLFYKNRLQKGGKFWKTIVFLTDTLFFFDKKHCRKAFLLSKQKPTRIKIPD